MIKEMTQDQFNALAEKIYLSRRENSPFTVHTQKIAALSDAASEAEYMKYHLLSVDCGKTAYAHLETL
tara:strand:- start:70 stop:273 length:204 start_codon:yes stop_codon:yes gene_type:complete